MTRKFSHYDLFLASPTDTSVERDLIESLVNDWNESKGKDRAVRIEVKRWENDAPVGSDAEPQDIIDETILDGSDLMVSLFWTKFASSDNPDISYTRHEIQIFLEKRKPVILYVLTKPIALDKVNGADLDKIKEYKKYFQKEGHTYAVVSSDEELKKRFNRDLEYNLDRIEKLKGKKVAPARIVRHIPDSAAGQWFEHSIKGYIDKYLSDMGFSKLHYRRELTYSENCLLWQAEGDDFSHVHLESTNRAREEAFNEKYGNYDYSKDLRSRYTDEWFIPITSVLNRVFAMKGKDSLSVLGVASNDGSELDQIFSSSGIQADVSVLDFSSDAIENGKKKHPSFKYFHGNMEGSPLKRNSYDVYLNLRSVHSSGVDMRQTVPESLRLLKPGGACVFSVSDGYLVEDEKTGELIEQRGMFDNRNKVFLIDKPRQIAEKIIGKMIDFGFVNVEFHSGKAEVFVIGFHPGGKA